MNSNGGRNNSRRKCCRKYHEEEFDSKRFALLSEKDFQEKRQTRGGPQHCSSRVYSIFRAYLKAKEIKAIFLACHQNSWTD